jgi:hypothetical protein
MRYAARRDANEATLLAGVEALGGLWLPAGPLDGWLWDRRAWRLCEVKQPRKEGWRDEFTEEQRLLIIRLNEYQAPFHVLRTEDDVLALMGARRSA